MERHKIVFRRIAAELSRLANCERAFDNGQEHHRVNRDDAREKLDQLQSLLPSGGGFDNGTEIDLDKSTPEKIVLNTSFHHMNDAGSYVGWTEHVVTVRPSFVHGLDIHVSGRNRNGIKEYIAETFHFALTQQTED